MRILRHIEKSVIAYIWSCEISTISIATKSKVKTLTLRRGLYSFIWLQGSREPHMTDKKRVLSALFLCAYVNCEFRTERQR
jgi:hypothetical protein